LYKYLLLTFIAGGEGKVKKTKEVKAGKAKGNTKAKEVAAGAKLQKDLAAAAAASAALVVTKKRKHRL